MPGPIIGAFAAGAAIAARVAAPVAAKVLKSPMGRGMIVGSMMKGGKPRGNGFSQGRSDSLPQIERITSGY